MNLTAVHFDKDKIKKKENVIAGNAGIPAGNDAKRHK